MTRQTRTRQADGAVRPQDNPRLREVARLIPRGTILDRRGVPIAMDSTLDVSKFAKEYAALGVSSCGVADVGRRPGARGNAASAAPPAAPPAETPGERCYPLGGSAFHLLGDAVSKANWAAPNSAFVERDFDARLRGYQDYSELLALWDHRDDPFHLGVRAILDRPRDVKLTIDARLQARAAALLGKQLGELGLSQGRGGGARRRDRRRAGLGERAVAAPRSRPRRPRRGRRAGRSCRCSIACATASTRPARRSSW